MRASTKMRSDWYVSKSDIARRRWIIKKKWTSLTYSNRKIEGARGRDTDRQNRTHRERERERERQRDRDRDRDRDREKSV